VDRDRDTILRWNPKVSCRTLDGTAFILLKSRMLSLNEVGTFIWESFKDGASLGGVVDKVVETFETTPERAESDAREFVHTLLEREMLVPAVSP
jgi:hypothetical protein